MSPEVVSETAESGKSQQGLMPRLERRHLGIDLVCLGCANFGGFGSNPGLLGQGDSEKDARRLMDYAWDMGIRWFDTADAYASGESEAIIGRWIRLSGKRPMLTTKTFNPMSDEADSGLRAARIERQLATSLRRLGIDSVELYLAHEFDESASIAETVDCFERCKARGYVHAYGVSNFDSDQLDQYAWCSSPALVQNSYSLLERKDEGRVLPRCRQRGLAYQAYSPLAGGWLTGKYRLGQEAPEGSRMSLKPEPYPKLEDVRVHRRLSEFKREAAVREVSPAGLALAWVLGNPLVASVVIGPRRPKHFDPVHEALSLRLDEADRDRIGGIFAS